MKRDGLLLLLTLAGAFFAWRSAQAAPAANGAAPPAGPAPGSVGFGEDLVLPPADPYARAELNAGPDAGGSSVLGGKLDWPFFVAVGASNVKNRTTRPGGITADHLLPVEPIAKPQPTAASSSSSYSAPSSGGYQGGGGWQGGGLYNVP